MSTFAPSASFVGIASQRGVGLPPLVAHAEPSVVISPGDLPCVGTGSGRKEAPSYHVVSVLHPALLGELGRALVLAGGVLAYYADLKKAIGSTNNGWITADQGLCVFGCSDVVCYWLASAVTSPARLVQEAEGAGGRLISATDPTRHGGITLISPASPLGGER